MKEAEDWGQAKYKAATKVFIMLCSLLTRQYKHLFWMRDRDTERQREREREREASSRTE